MLFILTGKNTVLSSHKEIFNLSSTSSYSYCGFLCQNQEALATWHRLLVNEFVPPSSHLSLHLKSWMLRWCLWSVISCTASKFLVLLEVWTPWPRTSNPPGLSPLQAAPCPYLVGPHNTMSNIPEAVGQRKSCFPSQESTVLQVHYSFIFLSLLSLNAESWLLLETDCQSFEQLGFSLEVYYLAKFLFFWQVLRSTCCLSDGTFITDSLWRVATVSWRSSCVFAQLLEDKRRRHRKQ